MPESTKPPFAYVGLGSNLGDCRQEIENAIERLKELSEGDFSQAGYVTSPPLSGPEQPDYLNTVCRFRTSMGPAALLGALHQIEAEQGRTRTQHWGPRTLDLDLLLLGKITLDGPGPCIPHPEICNRIFVLTPLLELNPNLKDPRTGTLYRDELDALKQKDPKQARNTVKA